MPLVWNGEEFVNTAKPKPDPNTSPGYGVQCCRDFTGHLRDLTFPVCVEGKVDGFRFTIGQGRVRSRSGSDYTELLPHWAEAVSAATSGFLDGEIQARWDPAKDGKRWRSAWGKTQSLLRSRQPEDIELARTELVFHPFDHLAEDVFSVGLDARHLKERKESLEVIAERLDPYRWIHYWGYELASHAGDIPALYRQALEFLGLEGIVIKRLDEPYTPSSLQRFRRWWRIKPFKTVDAVVIEVTSGLNALSNTLGSLEVILPSGETTGVGVGFTDAEREEIWLSREKVLGRIVEVRVQDATDVATARHPVFVRFRPDKDRKKEA